MESEIKTVNVIPTVESPAQDEFLEEGNGNMENMNSSVQMPNVEAPAESPVDVPISFPNNMTPEATVITEKIDALDQPFDAKGARVLASHFIHSYFTTQLNPLTRHHLESFDQYLSRDLPTIIRSQNPITILKYFDNVKPKKDKNDVRYEVEMFIGGLNGDEIFIGTPTISLQQGADVRLLFPNEARLRNLTYSIQIEANVLIRVTIRKYPKDLESKDLEEMKKRGLEGTLLETHVEEIKVSRIPLCSHPLMLHSSYCLLHGKPKSMLTQMGECPQDEGGYFIVDGAEKVLITRQEGAFNTLWIDHTPRDEKISYMGTISSLNPKTRDVKTVKLKWTREKLEPIYRPSTLFVEIPQVETPIPIFILFRAMGIQTDKDILQLIFPDFQNPETKLLADLLIPSMNAAAPFLDTYSAIQFIKNNTKGYSEFHVLDIIHNQLFGHVEDLPKMRVTFLAECVRKILRVVSRLEKPLSRDDTRYQRLLTSGFLCQMLFQNNYKEYVKHVKKYIDETYSYNKTIYSDMDFLNIFSESSHHLLFKYGHLTQGIMRGFKGKWSTGPNKEESGVLQELSRLSFLDFTSHLRRAVLNFDTSMKLTGPRMLHTTQYGYFCTSETPSGSHIGITKNLSIMTVISTNSPVVKLMEWLYKRAKVLPCEFMTPQLATKIIPVYLNSGIIGYTSEPKLLAAVLRLMKRSGYLPPLSSSGFNIPERRVFLFLDDGRPLRPLLICIKGLLPPLEVFKRSSWRDYTVGLFRKDITLHSRDFVDPLEGKPIQSLQEYLKFYEENADKLALIEYLDPFEQNEALIANYPEHVTKLTTHMEVHASTILGLLGNMIPYPHHNQSPRNQLSASQSKQGISLYATNFQNRFDNTANILSYGQAPLCRTLYQDYIGDGKMHYGQNIILAMGTYGGYNQEDGIIMNADALERGQFRSINYRSYEAFEEEDLRAKTKTIIANPTQVPAWLDLKPNVDYTKLDENGIVKEGSYVDQYTVIVGRYMIGEGGKIKDASVTPQVWTYGRVEKVVVMVNNLGKRLVKIRVTQDRIPVLGDKFSNRHGQKGTINVMYRSHDMPRTAEGVTPDMIMNPTAIPSRMTIGQILEQMFGLVAAELGAYANMTAFMNDGSPHEMLGSILEQLGLNKMCNTVLYNGMTGEQMQADIFMGVVYGMRLKHMTNDKWNARGAGRKEQRTHQPTGGRGNEGGLKIGEMERDAIAAHGITAFIHESYTTRSDGDVVTICNGCGTVPIYNLKENFYLCPLCDGPIQFSGDNASNLTPIPPPTRSAATFSQVEIPYATKLFIQEIESFANIGIRLLTTKDTMRLKGMDSVNELIKGDISQLSMPLPQIEYKETVAPELPSNADKPYMTAADVANQIAKLNTVAIQEYQTEQEAQQMNEAGLVVTNMATNTNMTTNTNTNSNSNTNSNTNTNTTTNIQEAPQQTYLNVEQQTGGAPIIQVDTSDAAMNASGLVQPIDATYLVPAMNASQNMMRPRRQRRQSPNMYGGNIYGQNNFDSPPAQIASLEGQEAPQEGSHKQGPISVVKLE